MARSATAARSRALESEATRRAILDAAGELLATGGEEGLSIREVCLRAGVTPPTIYHHFGDKAALVDRVVDDCFSAFDGAFEDRAPPSDPVERLRWGYDHYVEYGVAHPEHYRLMFFRAHGRPTPAGLAFYDRLRRSLREIEQAGRLAAPIEDATAALWSSVHGVTSLVIAGFWAISSPAIALARDAMIEQLTRPPDAPGPGRSTRRSARARASEQTRGARRPRSRGQRSGRQHGNA